MGKDYYKILGVDKNASKTDVKKAFHKLAKKHHPDSNGGDDKKFKEINEAYQTLSNDKKRSEYDTYGQGFSGNMGGGSPFGQGFSAQDFTGYGFDIGDIFGEFFSGGGARRRERRGRDISIDIELSFGESVYGVEKKMLLAKTSVCHRRGRRRDGGRGHAAGQGD